jgi:molecular chaperone Hsp33
MNHHPINKTGHLYGYISNELGIRASVVLMTDLVEQVCSLQKTTASSSVALGRALVGTVLLASQLKERQAISIQVQGEGLIKRVFAHAQHEGLCRGTISEKQAPLNFDDNGLSIGPLVGEGLLQVTTYIPNQKRPRVSQVPLATGEIGEDLAQYLSQSQQIPCLLSLGVKIGSEGEVVAAGGVLIELMPGHTDQLSEQIEAQQSVAQSLSHLIEGGETPLNLLRNHLGPIEVKQIKDHSVSYTCTCSKDKAAQSLQLLDSRDFDEILASPETLNVDCDMCGLNFCFSHEEIQTIYKDSGKAPLH